ncbi:small subunit of acetolactate synthase-domain-containing protein [Zychaea mexicana]|uniref:small subunit of acetolactate synthase-domain-containing protein n=1 Tax=Zychaea mexicana TaxID=64656 RepID=UPI0022FE6843|nr:small subunit of acetolactate synthase-domain-containing protein [Zychaea mexicana]KAI9498846.1 small subunit of acetolactate synthase-domain-containing protein [Zychaea mexicana]
MLRSHFLRATQLAHRRCLNTTAVRTSASRRHFPPATHTPSVEQAVYNILHNTTEPKPTRGRQILSCLAHNEPGVITRVSGILQSRGFNIESFVAAHTELPGLSRMTVVLNGDGNQIEQAKHQLEDIVPMWAVLDYTHTKLVERELLLLRVSILGPEGQSEEAQKLEEEHDEGDVVWASKKLRETSAHLRALTELTRLFEGRLLDVSSDSVIIELCAKPGRITSFIKLCRPFGLLEASRTGVMALPRAPLPEEEPQEDEFEDDHEAVDATSLPPG